MQTTFPDRRRARGRAAPRVPARDAVHLCRRNSSPSRAGAAAVAELYRARGLSTDTAVEAGYVVYNGLGIIRALEPEPAHQEGADCGSRPRPGAEDRVDGGCAARKLSALGRHRRARSRSACHAPANCRSWRPTSIRGSWTISARSRVSPPVLTLVSEIRESDTVTLSADYREYFGQLGKAIADADDPAKGWNRHARTGALAQDGARRQDCVGDARGRHARRRHRASRRAGRST